MASKICERYNNVAEALSLKNQLHVTDFDKTEKLQTKLHNSGNAYQ